MYNPIHVTTIRRSLLTIGLFALVAFVCSPSAQAVSPAPDGGYPGENTAEGTSALLHLSGGTNNTAVGWAALGFDVTANLNTAIGAGALLFDTADQNTATGAAALLSNTTGGANTANGAYALFTNSTGSANTSLGFEALKSNTAGDRNCALGAQSLQSNTEGQYNTAIGERALSNNTIGSFNTVLGTDAGLGVTTASNVIVIGPAGANVDDSCYIANIWNQPGGSQPVYVNSEGKLGAQVSSRRFKDEIKSIGHASELIYGLKPVSFRYKAEIEPTRPLGFGLIAEEVEKINPDLVTRSRDGEPNSVRYDAINAMLLNEFLKAHKQVESQQATITKLKLSVAEQTAAIAQQRTDFNSVRTKQQNEIQVLSAQLKQQAAQIRKVSAQLESNKRTAQMVSNNR